MKLFAVIACLTGTLGKRIEAETDPDKASAPGRFSPTSFTPHPKKWTLGDHGAFMAEGSRLGLAGSDWVANGSPITLEVERTARFFMLTAKHAHYVIKSDDKAIAWMRSKFNAVSGFDWDLLPGDATLKGGFGANKSPQAKKRRLAKGKGIVFPFNPTYFAKAYITAPDAKRKADDVYYTITHLNPISKGMKNLGEAHVRITRGWCNNAAAGKKCRTDAEVVCTFYHKSCVLKTKAGVEIATMERTKKGFGSGGNWKIVTKEGDALLFAQMAGFVDITDDMKRSMTLGPVKYPVNAVERAR